jgi:hypothetical protein
LPPAEQLFHQALSPIGLWEAGVKRINIKLALGVFVGGLLFGLGSAYLGF